MSKSLLYVTNTQSQTVSAGSTIGLGSVIRKYGNNINVSGDSVVLNGAGYYDIDSNITITPSAQGTLNVVMYANGQPISGAETTLSVEASSIYGITIPAVVRAFCCNPVNITVVVLGVSATVTNVAIKVEKE